MSATSNGFMSQPHHRLWVRVLSLFFALSLSGCHSWKPVTLGPEPHPDSVRVTMYDASGELRPSEIVHEARIVGDTLLTGVLRGAEVSPFPSISLDQVAKIEQRKFDFDSSFFLFDAMALLAGAVILLTADCFGSHSLLRRAADDAHRRMAQNVRAIYDQT